MSWMLRLMVGNDSMAASPILSVAPARDPVKIGETSALTTTVSLTAASCSRTGRSVDSPSRTTTSPRTALRKPDSAAVT